MNDLRFALQNLLGGTGFCTSHFFMIIASCISKWDVRKHVPPMGRFHASTL
jgi:hypothetical protein